MNKPNMPKLKDADVLLAGLAFTSRTETLEDYLKGRVKTLTVIAISSCFLKENLSACRVYENGAKIKEFKIPNFRIKDYRWYRQPLVLLVFMVNWISVCHCLFKLKKRYDLYFGISHSFALWGAILKKLKVTRALVYYCIDYYLPDKKINFNSLFVRLLNILDRFTVKTADYIWDLSPRIPEFREKIAKINPSDYKNTIVPLGYSKHVQRFVSEDKINRWDIGFVGCISENQGLQLLAEAMPLILADFPKVKVKIIGEGPYSSTFKRIVSSKGLDTNFEFLGFIKDENMMLDILAGCAVAVALYKETSDNKNIVCADPGKTKLYALCGIPIITTSFCIFGDEITLNKAGIVIDYNPRSLKDAVSFILSDNSRLKELKFNSYKLGENFISANIFNDTINKFDL